MRKNSGFSLLNVSFKTMDLLTAMVKNWRVFLGYAAILTSVSLLFGRWSYSCESGIDGFWCYQLPHSKVFAIVYLVLFYVIDAFLFCSFISDYYNTAYKNGVFKLRNIFYVNKEKAKNMAFFLLCMLIFVLPIVISYKILLKPANPNWIIEFMYFIAMFVMVFVPIGLIRLSSFMAYFLQNGTMPPLQNIWQKTADKTHVNIIIMLLLLLCINVLMLHSMGYLSAFTHRYNTFMAVVFGEYADCLVKLLLFAIIVCFCRAQYEVLEQAENSGTAVSSDHENTDDNACSEEVIEEKTFSKKKRKSTKLRKKSK